MRFDTLIIIVVLLFLFTISCDKEIRCFQKSGNYTSITYKLPDFDTIIIQDVFHINLNMDTTNFVVISGYENYLSSVKYKIKDNVLYLKNTSMCLWTRPKKNKINITISFNTISKIILEKSCKIRSNNTITGNKIGLILKDKMQDIHLNIDVKEFYFWNNFPCGGNLKLEGSADTLVMWTTSIINVDTKNLNAKVAKIESNSRTDIHVRVLEELYCTIKHLGNVYYYGNPHKVYFKREGEGKIINADL